MKQQIKALWHFHNRFWVMNWLITSIILWMNQILIGSAFWLKLDLFTFSKLTSYFFIFLLYRMLYAKNFIFYQNIGLAEWHLWVAVVVLDLGLIFGMNMFLSWLFSLTNFGTKYPTEIPIEKYFYFLEHFKPVFQNYNKPINYSLYPDALINVLQSSNCPK